MKFFINGKEVSEAEAFYAVFNIFVKEEKREKAFLEELNKREGTVEVYNGLEYGVGTILKCTDPQEFQDIFEEHITNEVLNVLYWFDSDKIHAYFGDDWWKTYPQKPKYYSKKIIFTYKRENC